MSSDGSPLGAIGVSDCRVCRALGFDDELRASLVTWLSIAVACISGYDLWLLAQGFL
jgi:hypothetical protein